MSNLGTGPLVVVLLIVTDCDIAVLGREVAGPLRALDGMAAALRNFARSRGESICETTVSSIFADPTIIDFGRGLRAAVFASCLGTACVLPASLDSAGPIIDTGLAVFRVLRMLQFVAEEVLCVAVAVLDTSIAGLVLHVLGVKPEPSDRFKEFCTLYVSCCIKEPRGSGIPTRCVTIGEPGLEGVETKENDASAAVLGRGWTVGDVTVLEGLRSRARGSSFNTRLASFDSTNIGGMSV